MTILTNILSSSWPTSGVANAGSVGVDSLSGSWSFGEDTSIPVGQLGRNYFENDVSGSTGTMRIDSSLVPFVGSDDYWIKFFVKFITVDSGLYPADLTNVNPHSMADGGTKLRTSWTFRNVVQPGFSTFVNEFMTQASKRHIEGIGATAGFVTLPLDEWVEVAWHHSRDDIDGRYSIYINGICVGEIFAADTENELSLSDSQSDWFVIFPGGSGMKLRISGSIESWKDTDIPIRPKHEVVPSNSYITKRLFQHWNESVYTQGVFWDISGTSIFTSTGFSTSGINPFRKRLIISGTSGSTFDIQSIDNTDILPFNEFGDSTIVLTDFYLPGTARPTLNINLKDANNINNILSLTIDNLGNLKQGNTILKSDISASLRYALNIHLSNTGKASWSLIDLTSGLDSQVVFSGELSDWIVQSIGKIQIVGTIGDTAIEIGGINICEWVETPLFDSITSAQATGVTPDLNIRNHVAASFYNGGDPPSIPGNSFLKQSTWATEGFGRRGFSFVLGRSGYSRSQFTVNTVNTGGLVSVKGVIFYNIDGGSVNDILGNVSDDATRDAKVSQLTNDLDIMTDAVTANKNKMWLTTMVPRDTNNTGAATWNEFEISTMKLFNMKIKELAVLKQTYDSLIELSDVVSYIGNTTDYFDPSDSIHFNSASDNDYATKMISQLVIPIPPSTPASSATITLNPSSGNPGVEIVITGSGFIADSVITITYENIMVSTTPEIITSDSAGNFTATIVPPTYVYDDNIITATDGTNTANATFNLERDPEYCTVANVADRLRIDINANTDPNTSMVKDFIIENEDEMDRKMGHTFLTEKQTREVFDINRLWDFGRGMPIFPRHRNMQQFNIDKGDKFEVWNGIDYQEQGVKGSGENGDADGTARIYLETVKGILYVKGYVFTVLSKLRFRITYRYGGENEGQKVPKDIRKCAILMTCINILETDFKMSQIAYGGEGNVDKNKLMDRYQEKIDSIINDHSELITVW